MTASNPRKMYVGDNSAGLTSSPPRAAELMSPIGSSRSFLNLGSSSKSSTLCAFADYADIADGRVLGIAVPKKKEQIRSCSAHMAEPSDRGRVRVRIV